MGCGSSSLKGEKSDDATAQPIKKVRTDFSTPDYETGAQGRRDTVIGPLDPTPQKPELLSLGTEKQDNPLATSVAPDPAQHESETRTAGAWRCGADGCSYHNPAENVNCLRCGAPRSGAGQTKFENSTSDQQPKVQDPITRNAEDSQHTEPYRDVTASPTTPSNNNTFTYDNVTTQSQVTSAAIDRQGRIARPQATLPDAKLTAQLGDENNNSMGLFSKSKKSAVGAPEIPKDSANKDDSNLNSLSNSEGTSTRQFDFKQDIPAEKEALVSSRSSVSSSLKQSQPVEDKPKKKSLYRRWQDLKRGPSTSGMSDEDLLKYTGKSRAEFDQWATTTPGVAGGQAAGSLTAGGTSGFGMAGGTGEGLGGWGTEAGKYPTVR